MTTVRAAISRMAPNLPILTVRWMLPPRAQAGCVLTRGGHTEATIDLMTLAGFKPAGALCELTNDDGTMARASSASNLPGKQSMAVVTIEDLWLTVRRTSAKPAENRCLITALIKKPKL
ncbi:3,4-dihydroxy-2-butanone-4-phosphate synthase [Shigella flexneri]